MLRSTGLRALIVGFLVFLMSIPALFVADIINSRADYSRDTARSVGQEWGGPQTLAGPVLVLPVTEQVTVQTRTPVVDPETNIQQRDADGRLEFQFHEEARTEARDPLYVLPNHFAATAQVDTEIRARGIFSVPVYTTQVETQFDFQLEDLSASLPAGQDIQWQDAQLVVGLSSNRALRGASALTDVSGQPFKLEPRGDAQGVRAELGDPRKHQSFRMTLGLFGSNQFNIAPAGRENTITMTSDWADPSFGGAFLPNARDISETGFSAEWQIPHLARPVPQVARTSPLDGLIRLSAFGFSLYQPNDFYQKSFRAARYAVMFIALSFLGIFLADRRRTPPTHPVQYLLVGMAQLVFFVLMLALAEQIGFALAYATASLATIALITAFAAGALKLGRMALMVGAGLSLLYGVLYLILQSEDHALLAGSLLAFLAVAGTMFATRNDTWYGDPNLPGLFRRRPKSASSG